MPERSAACVRPQHYTAELVNPTPKLDGQLRLALQCQGATNVAALPSPRAVAKHLEEAPNVETR